MCLCLTIRLTTGDGSELIHIVADSTINDYNSYTFAWDGNDYRIFYNEVTEIWTIGLLDDYTNPLTFLAVLDHKHPCPETTMTISWVEYQPVTIITAAEECEINCGKEDRIQKEYKSIKLPENFKEQDRGFNDCCCERLVLGGDLEWQNDITSCWIKLSDPADTFTFSLKNENNVTISVASPVPFINDINAYYGTFDWKTILDAFGSGCYKIVIDYNISGIIGEIQWGNYKLMPYSIQNALETARIFVLFNGYHQSENINFRGSNVPDSFRFHGFIGFRQPNYEIDNLIYENREMKRNIRENLNQYEIITDPSDECIIKPLVELYLLSENELYISDYNAHNHSYRYQDLPVIVEESPKIEYTDPFGRKAVLKCTVGDKFKDKRTFY